MGGNRDERLRELVVRHLRDGDLPALQTIRAAAFAPIFASFRELVGAEIAGAALKSAEAEQSALLETLCQPEPCRRVLVAALDSGPVGFCSARVEPEQRLGEIELNAVHPDHAGLGIGSRLIGAALQWLKNQGAEVATVGTGADPSHAAARRAYQKVGFGPAIPSIYLYKRL